MGIWEIIQQEGNAEQEKRLRHQSSSEPYPPTHMDLGKKPAGETTLRKSALAVTAAGGSDNTSSALKSEGRHSAWKRLSIRLISQVWCIQVGYHGHRNWRVMLYTDFPMWDQGWGSCIQLLQAPPAGQGGGPHRPGTPWALCKHPPHPTLGCLQMLTGRAPCL